MPQLDLIACNVINKLIARMQLFYDSKLLDV